MAGLENSSLPREARFHSLDALRAVALLLGILLHAGLAYLPGGMGWAVQDRSTHWLFGAAILVIHSFRLEVFFLLAGFFGRLMYERRGALRFIWNRMVRVLIPFVAGWFLAFPAVAFAWIWGARRGDFAAVALALRQALGATQASLQSMTHLGFLKHGFPLTHLWFLYYLLLIYLVFLVGRSVLVSLLKVDGAWARPTDRIFRSVLESKGSLPAFGEPR